MSVLGDLWANASHGATFLAGFVLGIAVGGTIVVVAAFLGWKLATSAARLAHKNRAASLTSPASSSPAPQR